MGRTDALDRLATALIFLAATFAFLNGAFMVADPFAWYRSLPNVRFTGPPNQHFLRDIGLAYITCSLLLGYGARYLQGRWLIVALVSSCYSKACYDGFIA